VSAFASAIAQGLAAINDVAGELVNYQRGADVITGIKAVAGKTDFGSETNTDDIGVSFVSNDWIFRTGDLVIRGQAITPKRGDRVITAGGTMYEVGFDGDEIYRHSDSGQTRIRVHTKLMGG
jgi:hypothetical protein